MNDNASIGGSEIAAILGLSPWRTALDVWREKVLGAEPQPDSPALALGRRFEAALLSRIPEHARGKACLCPACAKAETP